jgi:glycosidase
MTPFELKEDLNDDPRRVKLSYLLMFLSAGAPNIYYGDEIGMTGEHDPDNRRCMLVGCKKIKTMTSMLLLRN